MSGRVCIIDLAKKDRGKQTKGVLQAFLTVTMFLLILIVTLLSLT